MTSVQNFRVDTNLKQNFSKLAEELGVSTTSLFTAFMKKAVDIQGVPFPLIVHSTDKRQDKSFTLREIKDIVKPIADKYDVKELYLFGSYARGEASEDSDMDFVVENENTKAMGLGLLEMAEELENAFKVNVDLVPKYTVRFDLIPNASLTIDDTKEWLERRFAVRFERERIFVL
jgi:addiction module RelB/DinJ family antitoxin